MAANTDVIIVPVEGQDHAQVVSFTELKPADAGFLYQPTINGKVYFTKSSLINAKWNGGPLKVTVTTSA